MSYHQKQDLMHFGTEVQRLIVSRLITARNAGRITTEQLDAIAELVPNAAEIQMMLDNFQPKVDIDSALAEIEPMVSMLTKAFIGPEIGERRYPKSSVLIQWRDRVEAAVRYLKADPR